MMQGVRFGGGSARSGICREPKDMPPAAAPAAGAARVGLAHGGGRTPRLAERQTCPRRVGPRRRRHKPALEPADSHEKNARTMPLWMPQRRSLSYYVKAREHGRLILPPATSCPHPPGASFLARGCEGSVQCVFLFSSCVFSVQCVFSFVFNLSLQFQKNCALLLFSHSRSVF